MVYKIRLKKVGKGSALSNLLLQFADIRLSGTINDIKQIAKDRDSAEALVDFNVDSLIKLVIVENLKALDFGVHDFTSVSFEAIPIDIVPQKIEKEKSPLTSSSVKPKIVITEPKNAKVDNL